MNKIINGVATEYDMPISKKGIKFEKVDGSKVFDLVMEIDKLQQENENLRTTIKNDDVAVNNLCKEIENLKQQLKELGWEE